MTSYRNIAQPGDRQWAFEFIFREVRTGYLMLLSGCLSTSVPDWHLLFHKAWSSAPSDNYDKKVWIRREEALQLELINAYARFLGRKCPDDIFEEIKEVNKEWREAEGVTEDSGI